jgi:hypothetical protein
MDGQPHYPDTGDEAGTGADREPLTPRQRWTRIAVILLVVVAALVIVVLHITGTLGPGSNG